MGVVEDAELQILERHSERVSAAEKAFDLLDCLSEQNLRKIAEDPGLYYRL